MSADRRSARTLRYATLFVRALPMTCYYPCVPVLMKCGASVSPTPAGFREARRPGHGIRPHDCPRHVPLVPGARVPAGVTDVHAGCGHVGGECGGAAGSRVPLTPFSSAGWLQCVARGGSSQQCYFPLINVCGRAVIADVWLPRPLFRAREPGIDAKSVAATAMKGPSLVSARHREEAWGDAHEDEAGGTPTDEDSRTVVSDEATRSVGPAGAPSEPGGAASGAVAGADEALLDARQLHEVMNCLGFPTDMEMGDMAIRSVVLRRALARQSARGPHGLLSGVVGSPEEGAQDVEVRRFPPPRAPGRVVHAELRGRPRVRPPRVQVRPARYVCESAAKWRAWRPCAQPNAAADCAARPRAVDARAGGRCRRSRPSGPPQSIHGVVPTLTTRRTHTHTTDRQ